MAREPFVLIKRRFLGRMLESGLLILAVALGVGAAASGVSLVLNTNKYSSDILLSPAYRELVITTKDDADDMETPLVQKNSGDDLILTVSDLTAAELVPQVSYAYISNRTKMRFLNQEMINRMSQMNESTSDKDTPEEDNKGRSLNELMSNISEAESNDNIIIPEIEELTGYEITPQFFDSRSITAEYGSLFTDNDMKSTNLFVVLGSETARLLAGDNSNISALIGKKILSIDKYYTIIGILEKEGTFIDSMFFSAESGETGGGIQKFKSGSNKQLRFTVSDPADLDDASVLLQNWFENSYGEDQFVISNPRAEAERFISRNRGISLLILILSFSGLFIASVNISHIIMSRNLRMKKHVGVLKALGASNKAILHLFGSEAIAITLIGAFIGTMLAFPLSSAMENAMGFDGGNRLYILLGVLFSSLLTFLFSLFPSFQNSRFEPAEAMRT